MEVSLASAGMLRSSSSGRAGHSCRKTSTAVYRRAESAVKFSAWARWKKGGRLGASAIRRPCSSATWHDASGRRSPPRWTALWAARWPGVLGHLVVFGGLRPLWARDDLLERSFPKPELHLSSSSKKRGEVGGRLTRAKLHEGACGAVSWGAGRLQAALRTASTSLRGSEPRSTDQDAPRQTFSRDSG
jgi:hypothetical protein